MILEKQDVFIKKDGYNKETDPVLTLPDLTISSATCLKGVYILTETEVEMIKQEYYAIGLKQAEDSFNSHLR